MNKKGFAHILVIFIIFAAIAAIGEVLYYEKSTKLLTGSGQIVCTQEAKLCPDGSAVGRTGPNCEFAACPRTATQDATLDWKTYRNDQYGVEIKYPNRFSPLIRTTASGYLLVVNFDNGPGYWAKITLTVATCDQNQDIAGCTGIIRGTSKPPDMSPISLPNFNGVKYYTSGWEGRIFINGGFKNNGLFYDVAVVSSKEFPDLPDENDIAYFNQVLSTFKFIHSTGSGQAPPTGTGVLSGKVTIGPICPVERIDNPCVTPPEAYASREFSVTQNGKIVTTFHADSTGNYNIPLAPGTYLITSAKTGIGYMSKDLPATVTIKAGEVATLNIDVDTGIR